MRYFIYCRKSSEAEDRQIASIESQLTTLQRTFGNRPDIEIVGIYEEAFSAAAPGRPQFGEMIRRVERGDAHGIIAWAPDRLARNSIDGGRLIYMLDRGVVHDLKFATYTFENNSQGKFMLQIMFGQSKYYSDALSDNVKRGNQSKIEKGWRPNQAPLGYLNDSATKTIIIDPVHFPLIRKMFDLMLSGAYTPKRIALTARDEWGFRTPKRKRIGGTPLAMSTIYKILSNPFYAGIICWNGQTYPGKHEPVVSIHEFQNVRTLLDRTGQQRPQRHSFAFTGMIRCGGCDLSVTAEHKRNRYGRRYIYYHCSRPRLGRRCAEPCVEVRSLEQQIETFLRSLTIEHDLAVWVLEELALGVERSKREENARKRSLENSLADTEIQLNELTGLRIRNLMTDTEFVAQRQGLQLERLRLREKIADAGTDTFEPIGEFISFSNRAAEWFVRGDDQAKRLILETVGSNLSLRARTLNVEAKRPFASLAKLATRPNQLGVIDDVRTFGQSGKKRWLNRLIKEASAMRYTENGQCILDNIRTLRQRFDPETLPQCTRQRLKAA